MSWLTLLLDKEVSDSNDNDDNDNKGVDGNAGEGDQTCADSEVAHTSSVCVVVAGAITKLLVSAPTYSVQQ